MSSDALQKSPSDDATDDHDQDKSYYRYTTIGIDPYTSASTGSNTLTNINYRGNNHNTCDEDSTRVFMSEPSVSEDGDHSSVFVGAPDRRRSHTHQPNQQQYTYSGSGSDDDHNHRSFVARSSPSSLLLRTTTPRTQSRQTTSLSAPNSPGTNTSLSSWEQSPAVGKHTIHMYWAPPVTAPSPQASDTNNNNNLNPTRRLRETDKQGKQQESIPEALSVKHKKAVAAVAVAVPVSIEPTTEPINDADNYFVSNLDVASKQRYNHDSAFVHRKTTTGTSSATNTTELRSGRHANDLAGTTKATDESIAMTLSDSDEDKGNHAGFDYNTNNFDGVSGYVDKDPVVVRNNALKTHASALKCKHGRTRSAGEAVSIQGHARSRIGDAFAANIATGGQRAWRGMQHNTRFMPANDETDEDEFQIIRPHVRRKELLKNQQQRPPLLLGNSSAADRNRGTDRQDTVQSFQRLHLPTDTATNLPEEVTSLVINDAYIVRDGLYGSAANHSDEDPLAAEYSKSWNPTSLIMVGERAFNIARTSWISSKQPLPPPPHADIPYDPYTSHHRHHMSSPLPQSYHPISAVQLPHPGSDLHHSVSSFPDSGCSDESDTDYSNDEDRPIRTQGLRLPMQEPRLLDGGLKTYDPQLGGQFHKVTRSARSESILKNIGKKFSPQKVNRAAFMPDTTFLPDGTKKKCQYYTCPRCGSRQREFITVSSAPRQLEGTSSYLALYFAVYVISSLFIFGLEEGWESKCVYLAC
jgi:hypothetical protein